MPYISLKGIIVMGVTIDVGLGILLLSLKETWQSSDTLQSGVEGRKKRRVVCGLVLISSITLIATVFFFKINPSIMTSGVFSLRQSHAKRELKFIKDGRTATVSVDKVYSVYRIATNGKIDGSVNVARDGRFSLADDVVQRLFAVISWAIHPSAKEVAVIGVGTGMTSHTFLEFPTIQRVDTIEIEKAMVEGAKWFRPANNNIFTSPRSHLYYNDAKSFFAANKRKYDIIFSEPSNPWVRGVAGLFSFEFYKNVKQKIKEGGLYVQWLQAYESNIDILASALNAVSQEFPYYTLYTAANTDLIIVASMLPIPTLSNKVFAIDSVKKELHYVKVNSIQDLRFRKLTTKEMITPYLSHLKVPANSDYYPYLAQNSVQARFYQTSVRDLGDLGYYLPLSFINEAVPIDYSVITYDPLFKR